MLARLKGWARGLRREVIALWFVARDPRTPWLLRIALLAIVAYALSPIDLIPDFIPVLGYLDEVLLLPGLIWLLLRFVPAPILAQARAQATELAQRPRSWAGAAVIVVLWTMLAWLAWRWWRA